MRILVLGAGRMGRAAAYDLAHRSGAEEVGLAEIDPSVRRTAIEWINSPKVKEYTLDVRDTRAAEELLRGFDAVLSAVPYAFNAGLARAAVAAKCHFCDLGGNNEVVEYELHLDEAAKSAGITIVPDCGLAPGMVTVVAAQGIRQFEHADTVRMRVGGLPLHPKPPLHYKLVFSPYGLINEYVEPAVILDEGRVKSVRSMTGLEELEFPTPYGRLEAFYTSGGTSTLPRTFAGKVRSLDYKTIRYPGHCERFRCMIDLGFADLEPKQVDGAEVVPRALLAAVLRDALVDNDQDVVLARITIAGEREGVRRRLTYELIAEAGPDESLTAMMRTTAFPAAIVAAMLADGTIQRRGTVPQELCVPAESFFAELEKRDILFEKRWEDA